MSAVGFELELLAPPERTRLHLARALAAATGCRARSVFAVLQRPADDASGARVELSPAWILEDAGGVRFRLVDDLSIVVDPVGLRHRSRLRLVTDDVRLARCLAREARGRTQAVQLRQLERRLGVRWSSPGEGLGCPPDGRLLRDAHGLVYAVAEPYPRARWRVAEVVTRPLRSEERDRELELIARVAHAEGFTAPPEGSVHVHFDGAPWQSVARLRRLILGWSRAREALLPLLGANPHTGSYRGPFSPETLAFTQAAGDQLSWPEFAAGLARTGLQKRCDLNLLGLVAERFEQVTLEARVFTHALEPSELLTRLSILEGFLDELQQ